jgi:hypothetical protein
MKNFGIYNVNNEGVDVIKASSDKEALRKFAAKQTALGIGKGTQGYWAEELDA